MFSLSGKSGKSKNQIPCFPCAVATLPQSLVRGPFWGAGGGGGNRMKTSPCFGSSHFRGGGGVGGTNFQLLMPSPKIALKKNFFAKNFLSFQAKMCLAMVLDYEYHVVRIYEVYSNHKKKSKMTWPP